jgi:uncharacterized membrane protein
METTRIVLRTLHILSGVLWVGAAILITLFIEPTVKKMGQAGGQFMERLVTESGLVKYMVLSSLATVVTGVVLYSIDSDFALSWVGTREGVIFTIGSVAGLVAYVTGQFVISPTAARIGALGHEMAIAGGPPSPVQLNEMSLLQGRAVRAARLELILMVISVAGMAGARLF